MTEHQFMTVQDVMTNLTPVNLAELRNGSGIERVKLRLDVAIINNFLLSCRCSDQADHHLYSEAESELRNAIKTVFENLDTPNAADSFAALTESFTYFMSLVKPGLSDYLEDALITS